MLGDKIRTLRKENKISQEELAEKLCVSRQSVSLWENGQTMPSIENIISIANIFGVSTDVLLKDDINDDVIEQGEEKAESETKIKKPKKKKLIFTFLIITAVLIVATAAFFWFSNRKLSAEKIYDIVSPATVELIIETDNGQVIGTGFFDDNNGTIITNYHVIERGYEGVAQLKDSGKFDIEKVLGYDEDLDIAILQIDYQNKKVLNKREDPLSVGEAVYALGSSVGLTDSFSSGIVSAVDRTINGNAFIQITAPISHGNSGGPLVDGRGNVVGITSAGIEDGQNLNLAIPIANIQKVNRGKDWDFIRFYNLTDPNRKTFDEIKAAVQNYETFIGIDYGDYKGTFHERKCSLVEHLFDRWMDNQESSKYTIISCNKKGQFNIQKAFDAGYKLCSECNCVNYD